MIDVASKTSSAELTAAYAECRAIARREAKNFYYAFRVLPQHKSDAMCAIYAFMRKADDLADDESMSIEDRRAAMAIWTADWRASRTAPVTDPVFLAVNDVQQRFGISVDLLEQLVAGTTLDLQPHPEGVVLETVDGRTLQVYQDFASLRRYCYLVASVVGLVCIRIFGYTDPRAEPWAIDTGVAFQLTNILRDVKEDAERGRIYISHDLLAQYGVTPQQILSLCSGTPASTNDLALLRDIEQRAQDLYRSADRLVPLLDPDSRPAMRVLATIYHRLLDRIAADRKAIFRERVSVPTVEKLAVLSQGVVQSAFARLFN